MSASRWASRPRNWAAVAACCLALVCGVCRPRATGYALAALLGGGALVYGVRRFLEEQRPVVHPTTDQQANGLEQVDESEDDRRAVVHVSGQEPPAETEQPPCRCAGVGFGGNGDCPVHDDLTAEEARDLAEETGRELYLALDALAFVSECCDIADRTGRQPTTTDVRQWLKGAQCARQSGLVYGPDGWARDPDAIRTDPDASGQRAADQAGHDPDALRTRVAAAIRTALKERTIPPLTLYGHQASPGIGLTEHDLAEVALAELAPELARAHSDLRWAKAYDEEIAAAHAEARRLSLTIDDYSAGARGMGDKLRRIRDIAEPALCHDDVSQDRLAREILAALDGPATAEGSQP